MNHPRPGNVYWITGLSGSGKSTLAQRLSAALRAEAEAVVLLDGDELRAAMGVDGRAHSRSDRLALAQSYGRLCELIARQGPHVVIATISLFHEVHDWNRANLPGYSEIWLDVPLAELARRDPKDIYRRAATGELRDVAGVDFAIEPPRQPDVHVTWRADQNADAVFEHVWTALRPEPASC